MQANYADGNRNRRGPRQRSHVHKRNPRCNGRGRRYGHRDRHVRWLWRQDGFIVRTSVLVQLISPIKTLPAQFAYMRLHPGVYRLMRVKNALRREPPSADIARVRPLARVRPYVYLQLAAFDERFTARRTLVRA